MKHVLQKYDSCSAIVLTDAKIGSETCCIALEHLLFSRFSYLPSALMLIRICLITEPDLCRSTFVYLINDKDEINVERVKRFKN